MIKQLNCVNLLKLTTISVWMSITVLTISDQWYLISLTADTRTQWLMTSLIKAMKAAFWLLSELLACKLETPRTRMEKRMSLIPKKISEVLYDGHSVQLSQLFLTQLMSHEPHMKPL